MAKVQKSTDSSSLAEVVDRILDKGIVIDAWVKVSLVGSRIQIEGIGYIMKSCSFTVLGSFNNITPIYDKTPMLTAINSLLKDNFKEYFEKKKKKNE